MILFRVDAYPKIGMGHIIRSVAIADYIRSQTKTSIIFAGYFDEKTRKILDDSDINYVNNKSFLSDEEDTFLAILMKRQPDVVFADKLYPYSCDFVTKCTRTAKIILFHNLCEGAYCADKFILPSAHHEDDVIFSPRWKASCVDFYHGPKYIPINPNVLKIAKQRKFGEKKGIKKTVGITTGGSDPKGVMNTILEWLSDNKFRDVQFYAFIGQSFIHCDTLSEIKKQLPQNVHIKSFNYSELMNCDIAISTFGVTTYELMYMGMPILSIGHATKNAIGSAVLERRYGALLNLGLIDDISKDDFIEKCASLISNSAMQKELIANSSNLLDDKGIKRISEIILEQ